MSDDGCQMTNVRQRMSDDGCQMLHFSATVVRCRHRVFWNHFHSNVSAHASYHTFCALRPLKRQQEDRWKRAIAQVIFNNKDLHWLEPIATMNFEQKWDASGTIKYMFLVHDFPGQWRDTI